VRIRKMPFYQNPTKYSGHKKTRKEKRKKIGCMEVGYKLIRVTYRVICTEELTFIAGLWNSSAQLQ
jgi:hypothetical protein